MAFERLRAAVKRFAAATHLALGAALAGGIAGALVAAVLPAPAEPLLPVTAPGFNRLVVVTSGAFLGWWLGLLGGIAYLALRRRP
jgi:hypothetical protein